MEPVNNKFYFGKPFGKLLMTDNYIIITLIITFLTLSLINIHCKSTPDSAEIPEINLFLEPLYIDTDDEESIIFHTPGRLQVDNYDNIYILDHLGRRISKFSPDGNFIKYIGKPGEGPGEFAAPAKFRINDGIIYVLDVMLRRISRFSTEGTFIDSFIYHGPHATSLAIDSKGNIALHQPQLNRPLIFIYNLEGRLIDSLGTTTPLGIESNSKPTPLATAAYNSAIIKFNSKDELFALYYERTVMQRYSSDGKLNVESEINGQEIELLHQIRNELIELNERQGGSGSGVMRFSYFSDFDLINDDYIAINLGWKQQCLYIMSTDGYIIKKYRFKPTKLFRTNELNIDGFVLINQETFLGIDSENLVIWKGKL